jgi:hypothetical protein
MDEPRQPDIIEYAARPRPEDKVERFKRFFNEYAWFIIRNVIGWLLILISPVLGALVPGPGGFPVFIIGFALVTFPGKRKLTARFLRGRRLKIEDRAYAIAAAFLAIVIPGIALWVLLVQMNAREELGLSEVTKARPLQAALTSAAAFAAGAVPPLAIAWLVPMSSVSSVIAAGTLTLLAALGALHVGKFFQGRDSPCRAHLEDGSSIQRAAGDCGAK